MIREIQIENYKSVQKLNTGRITVLIGENGLKTDIWMKI